MFGELWILIAGVLLFIGLVASQGLFLVVGAFILIITLAAKMWEKYAFRRVGHVRTISRSRGFIGDTLEYTISLSNDKIWPLIWVDISDPFPAGLELPGATLQGSLLDGNRRHTITTSLLPYQKASWKYTLQCSSRGYHRIGPVMLRSGDIFGFNSSETHFSDLTHVLVYPRIIDLDDLLFPAQNPLGATKGKRPLFQDTNWFLGQRDYQPTDPMKHIHWKGTARRGVLQTKVFDPIVSLNVLIAMNATTNQHPWQGSNRAFFERAVTTAASVASYCDRSGFSFGLASNAVATFSSKWLNVPMGAAPSQLTQVLEALAKAGPYAFMSLADAIRGERGILPTGSTVALITSVVTDGLVQEVEEIRSHGVRVLVFYVGNGAPEMDLPDVPLFHLGRTLQSATEAD